ncbi:unnamed protein product [Cylindrotheca closterium]|uniref:Endonuclease V n=1 Tax=Cylindrotheca closterium TaxID=2856 RepID=A0AAD2CIY9_9STRA|nr:unnamed protein product [Cylindrotheca closterium]
MQPEPKRRKNGTTTNHTRTVSVTMTTMATGDSKKRTISNSQREVWKLEQEIVASMVQMEADPPIDTSVVPDNPLFHVIKDDHKDVYSFSSNPEFYGGVDVSFPENEEDKAVAVYVIIDKRSLSCVYRDYKYFNLTIPYVSTFLAFREIDPLQELVHRQVREYPDMTPKAILVDGNGILHPRHAGIACFLGTRTNIPTIGIGKTLLYEGGWTRERLAAAIDDFLQNLNDTIGQNSQTLPPQLMHVRGTIVQRTSPDPTNGEAMSPKTASKTNMQEPMDRKTLVTELSHFCNGLAIPLSGADKRFPILGCALVGHGGHSNSKKSNQLSSGGTIKPIFVSIGHRVSLTKAIQITASLCQHRIPEPVRIADLYGRELMRSSDKSNVEVVDPMQVQGDREMAATMS